MLLDNGSQVRVRNIGEEVAVGDRVDVSDDGERVERVHDRRSALTRRASFEGSRGLRQVIASNIDTVFLVHSLTAEPNERRLERELVLAFDSGAEPVILLAKLDAVDASFAREVTECFAPLAPGVPIVAVSALSGAGLDEVRSHARPGETVAFLGASGVGKSTLVNALVGHEVQRTGAVRDDDQRGRHTTVAAELIELPGGAWLLDTPGLRAVTLWTSDAGIERAFADVFGVAEGCRFRDCRHLDEPGCAVREAIVRGEIDPERLRSMKALVSEEVELEGSREERVRAANRKGARKPRTP